MTRTHAKDYLIDFVNKSTNMDGWLKDLIFRAISTNGEIAQDDIDNSIYPLLKSGNDSNFTLPNNHRNNHTFTLLLKNLEHISGVAAIAENQIISFNSKVTLIYGMNGSGKSSYFRMLNEVCGGNHKYDLDKNIYTDNPKDIEFKIKYELNDVEKENEYHEGFERGEYPFNRIRVFDSVYASHILEPHEPDSAILFPYGLHLFKYISSVIDNLKEKINNEITLKENLLPHIDDSLLLEKYKNYFKNGIYNKDIDEQLKAISFTVDDSRRLSEVINEIESLQKEDLSFAIKLKEQEINSYRSLVKNINLEISFVKEFTIKAKESLSCYNEKLKANIESKKKFAILNELLNTDTPEWKQFIKAGYAYSNTLKNSSERCPYCNQPLSEHSLKLLACYKDFLSDKTERELQLAANKIDELRKEFEKHVVKIEINDNIRDEILRLEDEKGNSLKLELDRIANVISQKLKTSQNLLVNKKNENADCEQIADVTNIISILESTIGKKQLLLETYKKDFEKRKERIESLKKESSVLKEKKSLSEQIVIINSWSKKVKEIHYLQHRSESINTRSITSISKRAYNDLITDNLCTTFKEELNKIGFPKLDVNLELGDMKKGSATLKLKLLKVSDINTILSEGERKGIALALFLSEIRSQNNNCPVIFDDPVNSLDHRIIENFATMLKDLPNQIIIFSHNILFRQTLQDVFHKNISVYTLHSYSKERKGLVREADSTRYGALLIRVGSQIKMLESIDEISITLRKSIEHIIDEYILANVVPTRYFTKQSIDWNGLKKVNGSVDIDELKNCYNKLSHQSLHNGIAEEENHLDYDDLKDILRTLKNIVGMH